MQKTLLIGASALHRCEDEYEFELEGARSRLSNQAPDQSLFALLLGIVGEFTSNHGTDDLRHFLVLLKRHLDMSSRTQASGLVAHYLDYGMDDARVSHCGFGDMRMAALSMHSQSSRSSSSVKRARR